MNYQDLVNYTNDIEKLDYKNYIKMTEKFGKQITDNFLKYVIKNIKQNKNLKESEREEFLSVFDGYINRNKYKKELETKKEELELIEDLNIEDIEITEEEVIEDSNIEYIEETTETVENFEPVALYIKQICSIPMLTIKEEKELGKDLKLKNELKFITDKKISRYSGIMLDLETVFSSIKTEEEMNDTINLLYNYVFTYKDSENKEQKIIKYYLIEYKKLYSELKRVPNSKDLSKYFSNKNSELNIFKDFNQKVSYEEVKKDLDNYVKYMTARNRFNKANLRLVVSVAKKYQYTEVPILDLIQDGNEGLLKAVEKYDVDVGTRFSTYAVWWIRQSIVRGVEDKARTIRLPAYAIDKYNKIMKTKNELSYKLAREATLEEVASKLGMTTYEVENIIIKMEKVVSLDKKVGDEDDTSIGDFVPSVMPTAESLVINEELSRDIEKALSTLDERERKIIKMRFGLETGSSMTLEEVGQVFGVTRERIRQIEGRTLRKLRVRAKHLRPYDEK
ncbi:MAG: sigma-70 family RNA polymerase sigma factor [Firmicutes bacterium]|nr:sigma-70 family RNA polymerase sigma factor [Bacillota bacterium]